MGDPYINIFRIGKLCIVYFVDYWENFHDYIYVGTNQYTTIGQLDMKAGRFYRAVVKLCAEEKCFPNVTSNAIAIIYNSPVTGELSLNLIHGSNNTNLVISFELKKILKLNRMCTTKVAM